MVGLAHEDEGPDSAEPVLVVRDLSVLAPTGPGARRLLRGIDLHIGAGETLGLTGPSGSGKSLTALAILGMGPGGGPLDATGSVRAGGRELLGGEVGFRGDVIGFVPQDPGASLTPVRTVGRLLAEILTSRGRPAEAVPSLLAEVGFANPDGVAARFPHELSGGMQQRVAIAAALAPEPSVLLTDEPTSALDVTSGEEILDLLETVGKERKMAMLLISHDARELTDRADRVAEMRGGTILRTGPPPIVPPPPAIGRPRPGIRADGARRVLELVDLGMTFPGRAGSPAVDAVRGVSLEIAAGQCLGLVGPTGSGKSTVARCATRILEPTAGRVLLEGRDLTHLSRRELRRARPSLGMVFQNPASSLNPRRRAHATIEAPLISQGVRSRTERRERALAAARAARLDRSLLERLPRELSGGQQQRVALARALVSEPRLLVLDEPFTALDPGVETEVAEVIRWLARVRGIAILLITHDARMVETLADEVILMEEGRFIS